MHKKFLRIFLAVGCLVCFITNQSPTMATAHTDDERVLRCQQSFTYMNDTQRKTEAHKYKKEIRAIDYLGDPDFVMKYNKMNVCVRCGQTRFSRPYYPLCVPSGLTRDEQRTKAEMFKRKNSVDLYCLQRRLPFSWGELTFSTWLEAHPILASQTPLEIQNFEAMLPACYKPQPPTSTGQSSCCILQ